ncbi:unnamed protein product, partial [Ceratitis capitata]
IVRFGKFSPGRQAELPHLGLEKSAKANAFSKNSNWCDMWIGGITITLIDYGRCMLLTSRDSTCHTAITTIDLLRTVKNFYLPFLYLYEKKGLGSDAKSFSVCRRKETKTPYSLKSLSSLVISLVNSIDEVATVLL